MSLYVTGLGTHLANDVTTPLERVRAPTYAVRQRPDSRDNTDSGSVAALNLSVLPPPLSLGL
jgi:hypothetical protein